MKRRMGHVAGFYFEQAEDYEESDPNTAQRLLKVAERASRLSNFKGHTRLDKIAFIDEVVNFGHTTGPVLPIAFGISDYGREEYWVIKLLAFLRTHGMPGMVKEGMVKEGTAPDTGKPNIILLPLEQAWQMRAKHAYPGGMEPKRTKEAMERLRNEMKQGHFEPIPATKEELSSGILTEGKHRLIVAKELGIRQVPIKVIESDTGKPKINWNIYIRQGKIVYMPPEEYMERVNIFNRIGISRVIEAERNAAQKGYRGIGYYPSLSEKSYRSILEGIKAGNEIDIPNLVYEKGMLENQEGFHRALVARDLGIEKIPVQVIGDMPVVIIRALNLVWNPNLTEQVKAINSLKGKIIGGTQMIRESDGPAPAVPKSGNNGFKANPNLINKQVALASHAGTSFDPEKRAEQEIAEFVSYVQEFYERLKKHAKADRQKEYLLTEMERFQSAFASKYNAKLHAQGSCLSTMIAGPSGFPVRRAEKACSAADKRFEELIEFRDRAETAILRELKKMGVEEAGGEIEVLKKKIADAERNHEFMVKTNVIVWKNIPDEQKIREIMALGKISETTVREILKPDYMGGVGFPAYALSNDTANIHRMKERLIELEKKEVTPTAEITFTGGQIVDSREADRIQIFFDQKPPQETINKLRGEGWHWSPSIGAWQRKRTPQALESARRITGAVQPTVPAVHAIPSLQPQDYSESIKKERKKEGGTGMEDVKTIFDKYTAGYSRLSIVAVTQLSDIKLAEDLTSAIPELSKEYALRIASQIRALADAKAREMEAQEVKVVPPAPAAPKVDFWGMVKNLKITDVQVEFAPGQPERGYKNIFLYTYAILENGKRVRMNEEMYKGTDVAKARKLGEEYFRNRKLHMIGETVGENVRESTFLDLNSYEDYVKQAPVAVQKRFGETPTAPQKASLEDMVNEYKEIGKEYKRLGITTRAGPEADVLMSRENQLWDAIRDIYLEKLEQIPESNQIKPEGLGILALAGMATTKAVQESPSRVNLQEMVSDALKLQAEKTQSKPVQSAEDVKQQAIASIQDARTVEELQPILKGIGFLPITEQDKQEILRLYSDRYSMLMSERPFGMPVKTEEEKPRVIGAPTPQQRFEEEQRKKAADKGTAFRGQQKLTSGASVTKKLEEFGIKERMNPGMTASMQEHIRGAQAVRDVIHYFKSGNPPLRGILYRTRYRTYFVEAQDGHIYDSMRWEYIEAQPSGVREARAQGYTQRFRFTIRQDGRVFANENDPTEAENIYQMLKRTYPKSAIDLLENLVHPQIRTKALKEYNPMFGETIVATPGAVSEHTRYAGYSREAARGY